MPRDEFQKRKTKNNTAKRKYDTNGKFNGKTIRKYEQRANEKCKPEPKPN